MRDLNTTFMMKASWNRCSPQNFLWKSVLGDNYHTGSESFTRIDPNRPSSNYWEGICKDWDTFYNNLTWQIGDKETTRLRENSRIVNENPFINNLIKPLNDNLRQRRVSAFINGNGN